MLIKIMCEWCGKPIKTVTDYEKVRDAQRAGESHCQTCLKKVESVENYFGKIRRIYDGKVDRLIEEMKAEFVESIKKGNFEA